MIPAAVKTCKKTQRSLKSANWLLFYDQNHYSMQNGAILDFQMAIKQ